MTAERWRDAVSDPPFDGDIVWLYHGKNEPRLARYLGGDWLWHDLTLTAPHAWTPVVTPPKPVQVWVSGDLQEGAIP